MLAGQPLTGAPAGEVEERACAAACRATSQCNIYFWCPAEGGCSVSLTNATGDTLPYRHCALAVQPNALPGQAHPPEAVDKGSTIAVTSGELPGRAGAAVRHPGLLPRMLRLTRHQPARGRPPALFFCLQGRLCPTCSPALSRATRCTCAGAGTTCEWDRL